MEEVLLYRDGIGERIKAFFCANQIIKRDDCTCEKGMLGRISAKVREFFEVLGGCKMLSGALGDSKAVSGAAVVRTRLFGMTISSEALSRAAGIESADASQETTQKSVLSGGAADSGNASVRAASVLDKYGNNILRVAYSYLHNMSDAEDILQDTLIQYIRKAPEFENDNHEKAWLLTVAANLSKNKIEYLNIRKTDELSEELVSENKEDLAFVWDAVKQLPEKYREVIHLFYQEGYSTKNIADTLKRKEATVRSDLNRGRQQLKNILKEAYDFE